MNQFFTSLLAAVFGMVLFSTSAFATTLELDNDALSSAPGYNTMSDSWTYKTGSGLNGDYRIISGSHFGATSNAAYGWIYNVDYKSAYHYAYLNNASFTDPSVAYQIDYTGTYAYINQDTAPGGWVYLKYNTANSDGSAIFINGALSSRTGYAGADGTKITY